MKRFSKKPMKVTDAEMHPVELNILFSPVLLLPSLLKVGRVFGPSSREHWFNLSDSFSIRKGSV